jgi:hypothetical protein
LPYQANLGVVTSTVQGPLYESLLEVLAKGGMKLSQILASEALSGTPPAEMIRAVDAGVAMGMLDITMAPVGDSPAKVPLPVSIKHAFNRAVLESDALGGRPVALASELTGSGFLIGDFDAAILHELAERGRDGLGERVAKRLEGSGRTLQQDGKPVEDAAVRSRMVDEACEAFISTVLPELARTGILRS